MNEQLEQVMRDTEWYEAAKEMRTNEWTIEAQTSYMAEVLIARVLDGVCSVQDLRAGVAWANALDAEAVKLGVTTDIHNEALARRLAHHGGRTALARVRTSSRLTTERIKRTAVLKYAL